LAPRNLRIGLYFHLQPRNVRTPDVAAFVKALQRQLRRPITLVWDRYSVHRAAAKQLARYRWLTIEWLPAYAPELDPVEFVWNHTKYTDLANFAPYDTSHLRQALLDSLDQQRDDPWLKRSYFRAARLAV
jgi:transposase